MSEQRRIRVSEEDDARFEREYARSLVACDAVAEHMDLVGCFDVVAVTCERVWRAEALHENKPDITMWRDGVFFTAEVKHRGFEFTGYFDFPYRTIILDRKKVVESDFYISVSKCLRYAAVVSRMSRDDWFYGEVPDFKKGYSSVPIIHCPAEKAKFIKLRKRE